MDVQAKARKFFYDNPGATYDDAVQFAETQYDDPVIRGQFVKAFLEADPESAKLFRDMDRIWPDDK